MLMKVAFIWVAFDLVGFIKTKITIYWHRIFRKVSKEAKGLPLNLASTIMRI